MTLETKEMKMKMRIHFFAYQSGNDFKDEDTHNGQRDGDMSHTNVKSTNC